MAGIKVLHLDPVSKEACVRSFASADEAMHSMFGVYKAKLISLNVGEIPFTFAGTVAMLSEGMPSVIDEDGRVLVRGPVGVVSQGTDVLSFEGLYNKDIGHLMNYVKKAVSAGGKSKEHVVILADGYALDESGQIPTRTVCGSEQEAKHPARRRSSKKDALPLETSIPDISDSVRIQSYFKSIRTYYEILVQSEDYEKMSIEERIGYLKNLEKLTAKDRTLYKKTEAEIVHIIAERYNALSAAIDMAVMDASEGRRSLVHECLERSLCEAAPVKVLPITAPTLIKYRQKAIDAARMLLEKAGVL